jgi:hypothetical protein
MNEVTKTLLYLFIATSAAGYKPNDCISVNHIDYSMAGKEK